VAQATRMNAMTTCMCRTAAGKAAAGQALDGCEHSRSWLQQAGRRETHRRQRYTNTYIRRRTVTSTNHRGLKFWCSLPQD